MHDAGGPPAGLLVSMLGPVAIGRAAGAAEAEVTMTPVAQPLLRVLLASLALADGHVVSGGALIDALWGEDASRDRERNLQARVSALRRLLSEAEPGRGEARVVRVSDGYRLLIAPDAIDVHRFRVLSERARDAVRANDASGAAALYRRALGLWRGPALADAAPWSTRLVGEAARLEELRVAATEERLACDLSLGEHAHVVGELTQLGGEFPLRERLTGLLMLALWRCGRRGEALAAFDRTRQVLATELGLDPGLELRELHARLLADDPSLSLAAERPAGRSPSGAAGTSPPVSSNGQGAVAAVAIPRQLPVGVGDFTGRATELALLDSLLDSPARPAGGVVVAAVRGMAGVGKTALAVHWARTVADRFRDGQLYVNLRGFDPDGTPVTADEAISWLLSALGVPGPSIPASAQARAGLYRSMLADRRVLLLLDNAGDAAQVRPLLAGGSGCFAVVTSRSTLAGLAAAHGATLIRLSQLSDVDATSLLAARLGVERTEHAPDAMTRLVHACGGLPLALAIVAARAADSLGLPLASLADGLSNESRLLDALDCGDDLTSVRSVFSWSLRHLPAPAAQMFAFLGVHCGPDISVPAAASLAAFAAADAHAALTQLVRASLVTEQQPGRYQMHDLLRAYAAEHAAAVYGPDWCHAAILRGFDHYLRTISGYHGFNPVRLPASAAASGVIPERLSGDAELTAWLKAEHFVLGKAVVQAAESGARTAAWRLFTLFAQSATRHGQWGDWEHVAQVALAAARAAGDDSGVGWIRIWLAVIYNQFGDGNRVRAELARAAAAFERAGDVRGRAVADQYSGGGTTDQDHRFGALLEKPRPGPGGWPACDDGLARIEQALAVFRQAGDADNVALALANLAENRALRGDVERASHHAAELAGLSQQVTTPELHALAQRTLGFLHQARGEFGEAIACFQSAQAALPEDITPGLAWLRADCLAEMAETYQALNDTEAARGAWAAALEQLERTGHPMADQIRARLRALDSGPARRPGMVAARSGS
jgi:DNA-binding SARP family transcriptional activator/tetratricopeptide (TPR) repeat protein